MIGLSPRAVSAALNGNGRISSEKAKEVRALARKLGYRPNIMARGLMNGSTYLVGVVLPNVSGSFYPLVLQGIEDEAQHLGYRVIVCSAGWDLTEEKLHIEDLIQRGVDGLVIDPGRNNTKAYELLKKSEIPYVQIFHKSPILDGPSITVDNIIGAHMATRYLLETTNSIPYFIHGETGWMESNDRYEGFASALKEAGVPDSKIKKYLLDKSITWDDGYNLLTALAAKKKVPRAIFAINDFTALGLMRAAYDLDINIPQKLSVVGFDNLDISGWQTSISLTTVNQPKYDIGKVASQTLFQLIKGHKAKDIRLTPTMIVRESTPVQRGGSNKTKLVKS